MKDPLRGRRASRQTRAYPRAAYLIKELERAVRLRLDAIVEPIGLTAVQYTALSVLSTHPGMSSAQLARRSFVTPQAANEMVATLERRGLIRRRADPDGGRALWIHLTAAGERTLDQCEAQVDALESQLFGEATRKDEATFRAMLVTCREAVLGESPPAKRSGSQD
jgi:DNA-binding MarR family transcriptional regulator